MYRCIFFSIVILLLFSFFLFLENNSKVLVNEDHGVYEVVRSFSRLTKRNLRDLNFDITVSKITDSTWKVLPSSYSNETIIVDEKRGATEVLNEPRGNLDEPHPSRSLNKNKKKCDWKPLASKIFAFVRMLLALLLISFSRYHSYFGKATEKLESSSFETSLLSTCHPLSNTRSWLLPLISKGIRYLFSAWQRRNLWVARFISLWKGISPLNDFIVLHSFSSPHF